MCMCVPFYSSVKIPYDIFSDMFCTQKDKKKKDILKVKASKINKKTR